MGCGTVSAFIQKYRQPLIQVVAVQQAQPLFFQKYQQTLKEFIEQCNLKKKQVIGQIDKDHHFLKQQLKKNRNYANLEINGGVVLVQKTHQKKFEQILGFEEDQKHLKDFKESTLHQLKDNKKQLIKQIQTAKQQVEDYINSKRKFTQYQELDQQTKRQVIRQLINQARPDIESNKNKYIEMFLTRINMRELIRQYGNSRSVRNSRSFVQSSAQKYKTNTERLIKESNVGSMIKRYATRQILK